KSQEPPSDPAAFILVVWRDTVLQEVVESVGCGSANGHPCHPLTVKTGQFVPKTSTTYSLIPPKGVKLGATNFGETVFPKGAVTFSFFSPRYEMPGGRFVEDSRFYYDRSASGQEIQSFMQRLAAIGAETQFEIVRAAVALDRAWLAVSLKDEALIAQTTKD